MSMFNLPMESYCATTILPFSSISSEEAIKINAFYRNFILQKAACIAVIKQADEHKNCVALQIYAALLGILSQSGRGINWIKDKGFCARIEKNKEKACEREILFIKALQLSLENKLDAALTIYATILKKWPRDILAGLMHEFHCFETGHFKRQLSAWQSIEPTYIENNQFKTNLPELNHYLASYAYAFELNNKPEKAIYLAKEAIKLNPGNPWANHAIAHAYAREGLPLQGIKCLKQGMPQLKEYGDFIKGHSYFHLALLYLDIGKYEEAFSLYKTKINDINRPQGEIYFQTDVIIFLWRFDLAAKVPGKLRELINQEWRKIYLKPAYRFNFKQKHLFPFLSLMYFYMLVRMGKTGTAKALLEQIDRHCLAKGKKAMQDFAQAILAYQAGDFALSFELLHPFYDHNRNEIVALIGGSDEQRSVYTAMYKKSLSNIHAVNLNQIY